MTCPECEKVVERPDLPHVLTSCAGCGRELRVHKTGTHGLGLKIAKGETVVIPGSWLKLSLNPLKSTGMFSRSGMQWYAGLLHLEDIPKKREQIHVEIQRLVDQSDKVLSDCALIAGLDLEDEEQSQKALLVLKEHQDTEGWWAFNLAIFVSILRDAIDKADVLEAVWATACVERCRSMLIFKEEMEEPLWMGQGAKRIIDILRIWDVNRANDDEGFWQATFRDNAYAVSQLFAVPLVFIREGAYLGGMNVERKSAKLVDYLFSQESSREAVLVEIKTPATRLLGKKYRGTFQPSSELSGGVMQVLDYRRTLTADLGRSFDGTEHHVEAFSPKCVLIIGDSDSDLRDPNKRKAFEMFRANLKDVEVVTYDEVFRKLEILANLFGLVRQKKADLNTGSG